MGPADFIAYEPQLHADIPAETPLETGLRISRDIRIPPDPNARQAEVRPNLRPSPRPNPQPPAAEDAEINEQVRRVQTREQETDAEQAERDAEIAEILLGMRAAEQTEDTGGGDVLETTNEAGAANALHISGLQTAARAEEERMSEEESQRSCFLNFGDIDEPILGDEQSIAASHASNRSVNIQRSIEGRVPLEAPARYASPSLQSSNKSSSKKGASRRSTAFPAQRNNLLSWMESLPGRPPSNSSSPAPTPISTRNASPSPSPFRPIEDFVPSTPAQSVREMPPAPATPIRASVPAASASPAPTERTAFKLAKQLRNFQGCTHEQHHEADQLYHDGGYIGGTPLPNVLSSPKLIRLGDYNAAPKDMPKAHPILNLAADIHFRLRVPVYNGRDVLTQKYTPLHKIPHYYFGTMSDAIILLALNKIIESSNIILDSTAISPYYLDPLWSVILFAHTKNTKLEFMDTSLAQAYDGWQAKWSEQVTSEDSALLYDYIPEDYKVEATMRDTVGQTMFASLHRQESRDGLIYSQFYGLIKTPFNSSKVYVFNNNSVENLALDPGYIRSLYKKRAYANLWDLYDDKLLGFLSAQINKYCFLFKHVLTHIAMIYSLLEIIVIVAALRALWFYYGKQVRGMRDAMERYGLAPPYGENILMGNLLIYEEYKRRWRAVKDLRDVYIRFNQAESYKWLEYLHTLNLEQFDANRCPELTPGAVRQEGEIRFCYNSIRRMFRVDGVPSPPHFVTGNKMRFERLDEFFYLVRLTHWVLPYPSNAAFIATTKTSRTVELPFRSHPRTLYNIDGRDQRLKILKGFLPVILEQIKKKSLDELEDLMGGFSRDAAGDDIQDDPSDASGGEIGAGAVGDGDDRSQSRSAGTSRSIITVHDDGGRESVSRESASTPVTMSSGSIFVPSI
ncbi:hypothetical protein V8E51_013788 [Hyaloscypha variabilis]